MAITIGFQGKLSKGGTPTTLTNDACSALADDAAGRHRYQITSAAHRVLDPATAIVVKENAINSVAVYSVDSLSGIVTFNAGHTVTTPVTISGKYIPRSALVSVKNVKSTPKRKTVDVTTIGGSGYEMVAPTLLGWDGSFELIDYASNQGFDALMTGGTAVLFDYDPLGTGASATRGWVLLTSEDGAVDPNAAITTPIAFTLYDQSTAATALSGFTVNAAFSFNTT